MKRLEGGKFVMTLERRIGFIAKSTLLPLKVYLCFPGALFLFYIDFKISLLPCIFIRYPNS